jgi:hypothetical protein
MAKYSQELTDEICKWLRAGNNIQDSCELAGISKETYYQWKDKPDFLDATKRAELECKARNIAIIQKAGEKQWQASAWWMERKHNTEFALKQINELQGQNGGPIKVELIEDYLSTPGGADATSTGSIDGQDEVQSPSVAQESEKDINGAGESSTGSA